MKGEGWAPPFISCAQDTVGLTPTAPMAIRLWETFTFPEWSMKFFITSGLFSLAYVDYKHSDQAIGACSQCRVFAVYILCI